MNAFREGGWMNFLRACAMGKSVLLLLLITQCVYGLLVGYAIPRVSQNIGDLKLFDLMPLGYDATYARTLLEALGQSGRSLYLSLQIPLDMLYPGLFIITYASLLLFLLKNVSWGNGSYARVLKSLAVTLPLLAGFFDYLENIGILFLLWQYPMVSGRLVFFMSSATVLKSMLSLVLFGGVIVLFLRWGKEWMYQKQLLK